MKFFPHAKIVGNNIANTPISIASLGNKTLQGHLTAPGSHFLMPLPTCAIEVTQARWGIVLNFQYMVTSYCLVFIQQFIKLLLYLRHPKLWVQR